MKVNLDGRLFVIRRGQGDPVSLRSGEVVRAQVVDASRPGMLGLMMKGSLILARTEVFLKEGEAAFFQVIRSDVGNTASELTLKFLGYEANQPGTAPATELMNSALLNDSLDQLSDMRDDGFLQPGKVGRLLSTILKSMPQEASRIPGDILQRLVEVLLPNPQELRQSIQERIGSLLSQKPAEGRIHTILDSLSRELVIDLDKAAEIPIGKALRNTGILYESRLKAEAELAFMEDVQDEGVNRSSDPVKETIHERTPFDLSSIREDFKGRLLTLKSLLMEQETERATDQAANAVKKVSTSKEDHDSEAGSLLQTVQNLINDIERFQLLSKASDSFFTFLPLLWRGLREGRIAFTKERESGKGSQDDYHCVIDLHLEAFGQLLIWVAMRNSRFYVTFQTETQALRSVLQPHVDDLQDSMENEGLHLGGVNFVDAGPLSPKLLDRLGPGKLGIDVKV